MIVISMLCIYHGMHYSQLNVLKGRCSFVVFVNLQFGLGQGGQHVSSPEDLSPVLGWLERLGGLGTPLLGVWGPACVLPPSWPLRGPRVRVPGDRKQRLPVY